MFFTRFRRKLVESLFKTRQRGKIHFRPILEALENRLVPTAFLWKGTTSTDWNDNTNWTVGGNATNDWPAKVRTTDTAKFDKTAVNDCEMNVSVTLAGLTLD